MARRNFLLFDRLTIRDIVNHFPLDMLPLAKARAWGFTVYNDHNQALTVTLIGGSSPEPAANGAVAAGSSIAANTREPVATDVWLAFLGLRASYAIAPTDGTLTIEGWVQEPDE
jgi:hypothetical protein